jgi:bifunctional non-homologous end joining protein LigD
MNASFIEPMLLLRKEKLPQGAEWAYEIKLDGYRAIAFEKGGKVQLRSRNDNDFSVQYPSIAEALKAMPDNTIIKEAMPSAKKATPPKKKIAA